MAKLIRVHFMLPLQAIFKLTINNYLLNPSSSPERSIFNHHVSDPLFFSSLINFLLMNSVSYLLNIILKQESPLEPFKLSTKQTLSCTEPWT